jgi:hypothetical protein
LRTSDAAQATAEDIVYTCNHEELIPILRPRIYHKLSHDVKAALQMQLHNLIRDHAGEYVSIEYMFDKIGS